MLRLFVDLFSGGASFFFFPFFSLLLLFVAISNPKGHDSTQATAQIFERVIKNRLGKQIIDCFLFLFFLFKSICKHKQAALRSQKGSETVNVLSVRLDFLPHCVCVCV